MKFDTKDSFKNSLPYSSVYFKINLVNQSLGRLIDNNFNFINNEESEIDKNISDEYRYLFDSSLNNVRMAIKYMTFSYLFSQFESFCFEIIDLSKPLYYTTIDLNDLSNRGIKKIPVFFNKVLLIKFDLVNKFWTDICMIQEIRNIIVHGNGILDSDSKPDKFKDIEKYGLKTIFKQIDFDREFINNTQTIFDSFLMQMMDLIYKNKKNKNGTQHSI